MFLDLFTSKKNAKGENFFSGKITVNKVNQVAGDKDFETIVNWTQEQWGHVSERSREEEVAIFEKYSGDFVIYTAHYGDNLVGMFGLANMNDNNSFVSGKARVDVPYLYVVPALRSIGIGSEICKALFNAAKETVIGGKNAEIISIATINPDLNAPYQKAGAKMMGEGYYYGFPADLFELDLTPETSTLDKFLSMDREAMKVDISGVIARANKQAFAELTSYNFQDEDVALVAQDATGVDA